MVAVDIRRLSARASAAIGNGDLAMLLPAAIGARAGTDLRCYSIIEAALQTNSSTR
jgi:hypothetical protein